MTQISECVIKSKGLAHMCVNMFQGIKCYFQASRARARIFSKQFTHFKRSFEECLNISMLYLKAHRQKSTLILSTPKLLVFMLSTSFGHVVDIAYVVFLLAA